MQGIGVIMGVSRCFKEKTFAQSCTTQKESEIYTNAYTTHSYIVLVTIPISGLTTMMKGYTII